MRQLCDGIGVDRHKQRIAGVGVSAPGPLDSETGTIIAIPTLPGWEEFPLATTLAREFGLPVVVENDGIAAANGEWRFGSARELRHFVYVTVSTGIGGGVVVDGRLLHGRRGLAGHVGHMVIAPDGPLCSCGARGCFEALASGSALARAGREAVAAEPASILAREYPPGDDHRARHRRLPRGRATAWRLRCSIERRVGSASASPISRTSTARKRS